MPDVDSVASTQSDLQICVIFDNVALRLEYADAQAGLEPLCPHMAFTCDHDGNKENKKAKNTSKS